SPPWLALATCPPGERLRLIQSRSCEAIDKTQLYQDGRFRLSGRMLVGEAGREAFVESVITPASLLSIGHDQHFRVEETAGDAGLARVGAGNLPHDRLLGRVAANLDDIAGFQNVPGDTSANELLY